MPDINDINGVAIANVAKVDAVTKANIANINDLTIPSGFTGLLDTYTGAAAAYSVRLLRTAYTGDIMRVRRASDNVEADVGFDGSNELSLTSPISNTSDALSYTDFADFVDHTGTPTDAFVRYWYDQASTNDAGQPTEGKQPQIYDATTGIITANGKPAVDADAVDYSGFPISLGLSQPFTNFVVGENTVALGSAQWYGFSPQMNAIFNASIYAGTFLSTTVDLRNTEHMMWAVYNGTSSKLKAISPTTSQEVSGNAGTDTNFNYLLRRRDSDQANNLRANEIIFWDLEQSSTNLSGIESNLDTYYQIT